MNYCDIILRIAFMIAKIYKRDYLGHYSSCESSILDEEIGFDLGFGRGGAVCPITSQCDP